MDLKISCVDFISILENVMVNDLCRKSQVKKKLLWFKDN